MNSDQITGFVRHLLTFGGGYLVSRGWIDEQTMLALVGGVVTVVGAAWSWWVKRPA